MTSRTLDFPLDIIWPRLIAIADEMATTLFRTAFSHDVVEVHDMSTGLYDERGNLIAQTWLGATGHTGVMPVFGKNLIRAFPPDVIPPIHADLESNVPEIRLLPAFGDHASVDLGARGRRQSNIIYIASSHVDRDPRRQAFKIGR